MSKYPLHCGQFEAIGSLPSQWAHWEGPSFSWLPENYEIFIINTHLIFQITHTPVLWYSHFLLAVSLGVRESLFDVVKEKYFCSKFPFSRACRIIITISSLFIYAGCEFKCQAIEKVWKPRLCIWRGYSGWIFNGNVSTLLLCFCLYYMPWHILVKKSQS